MGVRAKPHFACVSWAPSQRTVGEFTLPPRVGGCERAIVVGVPSVQMGLGGSFRACRIRLAGGLGAGGLGGWGGVQTYRPITESHAPALAHQLLMPAAPSFCRVDPVPQSVVASYGGVGAGSGGCVVRVLAGEEPVVGEIPARPLGNAPPNAMRLYGAAFAAAISMEKEANDAM